MTQWNCLPAYRAHVAGKSSRHIKTLSGVCLGVASLLFVGSNAAHAEESTQSVSSSEESLLVATREETAADSQDADNEPLTSEGDALQPVPQSTDRTPDIAPIGGENSAKLQFGAALTKISRSQQEAAKTIRRAPAVQSNSASFEPVKFQGILVGTSTKQELIEAWGEPAESVATAEGSVLAFDIDPFQSVEVLINGGESVSAIKIALAAPLESDRLAEQLSLADFRPVTAMDDANQPLGQAFPERGVLFMFQASETDALAGDSNTLPAVSHVVIQQLDPLAFAMRAENCLHGPYTQNIADLKSAIQIDPQCAQAHVLLAKIYLATGEADLADEAAQAACEVDPDNATYQLLRGRSQEMLGEYDTAVLSVRAVLDREELSPLERAQALHQMGCLASLGDVEIASKAIGFHTRAIEIADSAAASDSSKERRAAKQILVDAHMAVAEEIARQAFNQKVQNLSLWVGRASGLAEDYIANDDGSIELRLRIAQRALAALGSFRPTLDPAPWVAEAEEASEALFAQSDDELWQAHVKWELGIAYLNALRVEHVRRETQSALKYGELAVDNLAEGASSRQAVHSSEQLIGQLYFQMGAVHAVHQLDHVKAAQWYDRAEPLLTGPRPVSELYAPRREGEMLVSMGVTFWQLGEQNRALDLTQSGVNLVESAVEAGILSRSTLGVPYGNLATMYQKLGEDTSAAKYAALSKEVATTDGAGAPRVGQAKTQPNRPVSTASGSSAHRSRNTTLR